jgi:hypothetical protein
MNGIDIKLRFIGGYHVATGHWWFLSLAVFVMQRRDLRFRN